MAGGKLTPEQLRRAVERAEKRIQMNRPGDEQQARFWLRVFQTRLERAESEGTA